MNDQISAPNKRSILKRVLFHGGFFFASAITAVLFFLNPLARMMDTYAYHGDGWVRVPAVIENKILTHRAEITRYRGNYVTSARRWGQNRYYTTPPDLVYNYSYKYQYLNQEYDGQSQLLEYWVPHEKTPTGIGEVTKIWVLEKDPSQSRFQFPVYVQHFILSCLIGAGIIFGLYRLRKYLMKRIPFYAIPPATKRERELAKRGEF
ncbi:DUF3592 domain-containing protein [Patescibacteria group bacterium]|nr:DUF3592 domain-containing protein [Patescibacteria group bacterium]MBP9709406.1 DUF3592 domain-containing protein [Patescibacteria group bacterium]